MKVNPSVKPICDNCKVIRRHGVVMVICKSNPRHETPSTYNSIRNGRIRTRLDKLGDQRGTPREEARAPILLHTSTKLLGEPHGTSCRR